MFCSNQTSTALPPACPQDSGIYVDGTTQSEDCLFATVYTPPTVSASSGLPVFIWFDDRFVRSFNPADDRTGFMADRISLAQLRLLDSMGREWLSREMISLSSCSTGISLTSRACCQAVE